MRNDNDEQMIIPRTNYELEECRDKAGTMLMNTINNITSTSTYSNKDEPFPFVVSER